MNEADRTIKAIEDSTYHGNMPSENKNALRHELKNLEAKAQPDNWAWQILHSSYGYDGDYTPSDWGEPTKEDLFAYEK